MIIFSTMLPSTLLGTLNTYHPHSSLTHVTPPPPPRGYLGCPCLRNRRKASAVVMSNVCEHNTYSITRILEFWKQFRTSFSSQRLLCPLYPKHFQVSQVFVETWRDFWNRRRWITPWHAITNACKPTYSQIYTKFQTILCLEEEFGKSAWHSLKCSDVRLKRNSWRNTQKLTIKKIDHGTIKNRQAAHYLTLYHLLWLPQGVTYFSSWACSFSSGSIFSRTTENLTLATTQAASGAAATLARLAIYKIYLVLFICFLFLVSTRNTKIKTITTTTIAAVKRDLNPSVKGATWRLSHH